MNSSEVMDSGVLAGGRSKFSRTCSLLSQYLKEKGSFGDLSLGLAHNSEIKGVTTESLNLLPTIVKSGSCDSELKSEAETAQMTIFYGGQVIVLDDFPSNKVNEIMMLAKKSSAVASPLAAQSPAESTTAKIQNTFAIEEHGQASLQADLHLPIARKNSLARFLEKRKDRIKANAPYQTAKPAGSPLPAEAWMEFNPQFPVQMQRH